MTLNNNALVSLDDAKAWLDIDTNDSSNDSNITKLINRVSTFIENKTGRNLKAQDYTEVFDGDGTDEYLPKQYPVNSISTLSINGTNVDINLIGIDEDKRILYYQGDINNAFNMNYSFTKGRRNCKLTYNAGYETIPDDLQQICLELISMKFNKTESNGVKDERIGDYSVTYFKEVPQNILDTIDDYRKVVL